MVSISGFSGQNGLTQLTSSEVQANTFSGSNPGQSFDPAMMGDMVDISDEARELLATKMAEFDAETPEDLSSEERDEIRDALEETDGVTERDIEIIGAGGPGGGPGGPADAESGEKSGTSSLTQGATDSSSDIDALEEEIAQLESEIEELQAKASTDEDAKKEMNTKTIELATAQAELTLLEQESA